MKRFFGHPFILSLLIIAVFVFVGQQGWLKTIEDGFFKLISPGQKLIYQTSSETKDFVSLIFSIRGIEKENERIREENLNLLSRVSQLEGVLRENEFLRKQIGLSLPEDKELVLANIVGQEPAGLGQYILIDKGKKDGLKEKDVVVTAGNLLVGQIVEGADSFSKVRLITDPNSRINALIQKTGIIGLTESRQDIDLVIGLLPQGEIIEEGELVVTSGLAGIFPPGLLIGRIERIISSDAQISQRARLKPAVDFNNLDRVFIIK